ncbi:hypothetical protein BC629DRAFT_1473112, partial [Irpex lacteus]
MPIIDTLDSTPRLPSCSNPNQPDISPINPPDLSPDSESENMMVHTSVEDQRYVWIDSVRGLITVSRHWHMCLTLANHSLLPHVDRFTSTRSSSNGTAQPSTSLHAPQPTKASGIAPGGSGRKLYLTTTITSSSSHRHSTCHPETMTKSFHLRSLPSRNQLKGIKSLLNQSRASTGR